MDVTELIDAFCTWLPPNDLAKLALCSKNLNHISTRRLYRHIPALSPHAIVLLLRLLRDSPFHASLVQSLVLQFEPSSLRSLYILSQRALMHMTGLQSLTVRSINSRPAPSWVGLLTQNTTFPFHLTRFVTNYKLNGHLASFLRTQPSIAHLDVDLGIWPDDIVLPTTFDFWPPARSKLFALASDRSSIRTLQSLLDTPNLERAAFGIMGDDPVLLVTSLSLSRSLKYVSLDRLKIWSIDSLRDCLVLLSQRAPNLQTLVISSLATEDSFPTVSIFIPRFGCWAHTKGLHTRKPSKRSVNLYKTLKIFST